MQEETIMAEQKLLPIVEFIPPTTRKGLKELIAMCLTNRSRIEYENIPSDCDTDWDEG